MKTMPKKQEIKQAEGEVKRYALLEAVQNSEGGQMLIDALQKDVVSAIDKLKSSYKTATDIELRTLCAVLDSRISLLWAFKRAPVNLKFSKQELADLMKEEEALGEG